MEITPDTSSAKRSRAKPKVDVKPAAAAAPAKKPAAKKPTAKTGTRKTLTTRSAVGTEAPVVATSVVEMPAEIVHEGPSHEEWGSMVATAAYYLAAARNFAPGHELDDWLAAERAIQAKRYG